MYAGAPLALLLIVLGGWYGYKAWQGSQNSGTTIRTENGFIINPKIQPSLNRSLSFPKDFPGDAKAIVIKRVGELRDTLKKNPGDYASWLDLAIQYKIISDFEGARQIWEYVNVAAPTQSISFQNLGNLYDLYLKDYPKSEENYLKAIANAPGIPAAYLGLHELYRYSYKADTTAAVDILKQGIDAVKSPDNLDLMIMLASYYKDKGDKSNAIKYYGEVRSKAQTLKNYDLANQMTTEIKALGGK